MACVALYWGCRKSQGLQSFNPKPADYAESHKYFPLKDGYAWNYQYAISDLVNNVYDTFTEPAKYSVSKGAIIHYRDSQEWSYYYWSNSGNIMGCCVDMVMLNYDRLGCNGDSTVIYQKIKNADTTTIYQYCGDKFTGIPGYTAIKCIMSRQVLRRKSGSYRTITWYFGYNVGLIYQDERSYDAGGVLYLRESLRLQSHVF